MKKGKSTSNKVGNIRSTIKNVININLAEKLAQTIKRKKKTKSVRKSKRISSTRQEGQQDFIELKPRGIMPQGNVLTSGSGIRISMPNQMFANKPSVLQPSTYAIPDKRVLGSFQPSSFAPRDQERQQSIVEKALIEAIKKTQPSGPDSRIVPSINPYDPNSIPDVADLNAIAADDSQKKKAQSISEFIQQRAEAKRESELEAFDRSVQERRQNIEEEEALRRSLEENIPLPPEEQAGFRKPSQPSQPKRLTRGVIGFLANYYNLTKSQDLKGFSAETVDNYENKVKEINPDIYEEAYRIQYGEAGQAPKNVQTVVPLLEKYIKSKPSVASSSSSSKFSEPPRAVIPPSNQPLFPSNQQQILARLI
jgi:hypothetical protein